MSPEKERKRATRVCGGKKLHDVMEELFPEPECDFALYRDELNDLGLLGDASSLQSSSSSEDDSSSESSSHNEEEEVPQFRPLAQKQPRHQQQRSREEELAHRIGHLLERQRQLTQDEARILRRHQKLEARGEDLAQRRAEMAELVRLSPWDAQRDLAGTWAAYFRRSEQQLARFALIDQMATKLDAYELLAQGDPHPLHRLSALPDIMALRDRDAPPLAPGLVCRMLRRLDCLGLLMRGGGLLRTLQVEQFCVFMALAPDHCIQAYIIIRRDLLL